MSLCEQGSCYVDKLSLADKMAMERITVQRILYPVVCFPVATIRSYHL